MERKVIVSNILSVAMENIQNCSNVLASIEEDDEELILLSTMYSQRGETPVRIHNYVERVVAGYSHEEFRRAFRMSRAAFDVLHGKCANFLGSGTTKPYADLERSLLASIWLLATPDSYRSVGERFDMSKSSLSIAFQRVVNVLCALARYVIQWPEQDEMTQIETGFKNMAGMRNVIGAIDGTYIRIKAPPCHAEEYINRKQYHSITLQAICDNKMKFIDVFAGYPSSVHDCRIFRNSDIYKAVTNNRSAYFPSNQYILGDKAYPMMMWCVVPFKDNGRLTECQKSFNNKHSMTRQVVERSFALLFGRFRRLKYLEMNKQDYIPRVVLASCVLHNICIDNSSEGEDRDFILDGLSHVADNTEPESVLSDPQTDENSSAALMLRQEIADVLYAEHTI